ncbi:type I phosphomannose isomerase catalytic subunit [Enterocloster lavalensis]|uniref:type I phosphomannose isomerase catalytic subunit n=1 Tax=Enterocloster lavalensis TaxID=460384 RepID=UPI0023F05CBC|nr:type I phosphomannose isomerase catalytic subunit [Enterocloster lavalensis]
MNNIGQLYTVQCRKEKSNRILNGPWAGKGLYDYYQSRKQALGLAYDEYPLLIALVDAKEDLSVQVHPDDQCAARLEQSPFGKTESWYFLEDPDCGKIVNGCLCRDKDELKQLAGEGRFPEIIDHLPVRKGDYVFVDAGTLHALGGGSLVYEIQENVDFTYRFYDYGRRDSQGNGRPLHLDKAVEAVKPGLKSAVRRYSGEIAEMKYRTLLLEGTEFENTWNTWAFVTVLDGRIQVGGITAERGTSVLLEPGEMLTLAPCVQAMAAAL